MVKNFLLVLLFFPMLAFADVPRGEKLVQCLWKDIKIGHIKKIGRYTSKHFQGVCEHQVTNRCEMLKMLKDLKISSYKLKDIQTTEGEKVITVTYQVFVTTGSQIGGDSIDPPGFIERRIDVWKKIDGKWKWVADATLLLGVGISLQPFSHN